MRAISRRILMQVRTSTLPREVNESPRSTVNRDRLQVAFSKIEVYALPSVTANHVQGTDHHHSKITVLCIFDIVITLDP